MWFVTDRHIPITIGHCCCCCFSLHLTINHIARPWQCSVHPGDLCCCFQQQCLCHRFILSVWLKTSCDVQKGPFIKDWLIKFSYSWDVSMFIRVVAAIDWHGSMSVICVIGGWFHLFETIRFCIGIHWQWFVIQKCAGRSTDQLEHWHMQSAVLFSEVDLLISKKKQSKKLVLFLGCLMESSLQWLSNWMHPH